MSSKSATDVEKMDPLSVAASVLAVATAAIQSAKTLRSAVQRYQGLNSTLERLQGELDDLVKILEKLKSFSSLDSSILVLLESPVGRCSQLCSDFGRDMEKFTKKSKTTILDWARMEFRRGDINDFIETLSGYKSTISVGLGTITLQTSKATNDLLEKFGEMIQKTEYNLSLHMQRLDEKLAMSTDESTATSKVKVELRGEKEVTEQCLRICDDARAYLESLIDTEQCLQQEIALGPATDADGHFEAERLTRKLLGEQRDSLAETIGQLKERLDALSVDTSTKAQQETLKKDIEASRRCLEVCKTAQEQVSNQKIFRVGEASAEDNSDQVLVASIADLFDMGKATSKGSSAQLVGFTKDETLQQYSTDRYTHYWSRGTAAESKKTDRVIPTSSTDTGEGSDARRRQTSKADTESDDENEESRRPGSNEMRKRTK